MPRPVSFCSVLSHFEFFLLYLSLLCLALLRCYVLFVPFCSTLMISFLSTLLQRTSYVLLQSEKSRTTWSEWEPKAKRTMKKTGERKKVDGSLTEWDIWRATTRKSSGCSTASLLIDSLQYLFISNPNPLFSSQKPPKISFITVHEATCPIPHWLLMREI